jgi:hypothetical protein
MNTNNIFIPISLGKNEETASFLEQHLDLELGIKEDTMNLKLKKQQSKDYKMEKRKSP